jgi:hypothetical protein
MLFSAKLAAVCTLLMGAVSAAPTARTATCPNAKVWGVSDPSVTWVLVGYERDITNPNEPAFDTSYQLYSGFRSMSLMHIVHGTGRDHVRSRLGVWISRLRLSPSTDLLPTILSSLLTATEVQRSQLNVQQGTSSSPKLPS